MLKMDEPTVEIYFDGACEPRNPGGTASYGWVIKRGDETLAQDAQIVGSGDGMTNNVAEYSGLIAALKALPGLGVSFGKLRIHGDSNLVCKIVSKQWGWKNSRWDPHRDAPHLRELLESALGLLQGYDFEIHWIPGEKNSEADRLSREILMRTGAIRSDSEVRRCPLCDSKLVERSGKFGRFYGCSHYPQCKFTQKIR
jgi:ribonuclease HI